MDFFDIDELLNWAESNGIYYFGSKSESIKFPDRIKTKSGDFVFEFDKESPNPLAYKELMTAKLPENCCVRAEGTRKMSPNGWEDGSLFDEYKQVLPEINKIRKEKGLKEIYG